MDDEDLQDVQSLEGQGIPAKRCSRCGDAWPLTAEFFQPLPRKGEGRWDSWCRACFSEYHGRRRRARADIGR